MIEELKQGIVNKRIWTNEELAQAEALLAACNAEESLDIPISIETLRTRSGAEVNDFVWFEQGELVGLLSMDEHGEEEREVSGMAHPYYRRRGIGSMLARAAQEESKARGIERLIFVCERFSRSGQAFIAAMGAVYDFSEHRMELASLRAKGPYAETIHLRKAGLSDVDVLTDLVIASFGGTRERTRQHIAAEIYHPKREYYLALLGDTPVGCFNLWHDNTTGIYAFNVLPHCRRRQFARQMLEQIITQEQAPGAGSGYPITLEVDTTNRGAIALYRSCGFQEITTYGYYNLDIK